MPEASAQSAILTPDQRIRVFISSTLPDLKPERRAVKQVVTNLKLHPVIFEAGARSHKAQDLYRAYLEQSHIYVGIFWESYGSVGPGMSISGLEDEYNRSAAKPKLIYVKSAPGGRHPRLEELLARIRNDEQADVTYCKFSTAEELGELVSNDIMHLLSERFLVSLPAQPGSPPPPAYLEQLLTEMQTRALVPRESLVAEARLRLQSSERLLILGEPGIGKTFLIGKLGQEVGGIYISLRNKTIQQVCSNLAAHLAVRRGRAPVNTPSEDEARSSLQEELALGDAVLILDEADFSESVAGALAGLDCYGCRMVFAARSSRHEALSPLPTLVVPPLDRAEVEHLLDLAGISMPPGEFENVWRASLGNPLYLFYYTQRQVSPLPQGLDDYQRALWQHMPSIQKEIAGLVATSLSPLALPNLHDILGNAKTTALSPMALKDILAESEPLIRRNTSGYDLFHPYFEEYVQLVAAEEGIDSYYHSLLAEHWLKMKQPVATAFHMIRSNDPRVRNHLAAGATSAIFQGNWPIAEEITQRQLDLAVQDHDEHQEAYSRYLLGQVYLERGKHASAHAEADASIQLFDKLGEKEWSESVRLWSSLILVEEGQATEALEILESALLHYGKRDPRLEAFVQLYCAQVYSKLSRFTDGAKAAQRAMRLFKRMNDEQGVYVSLSNLSLCVGELGDRKLQEKYARQIIDAAERLDLPRMKASGLNQLAVALRKKDDSEGARKALREAISIAQQVGSVDIESMNIANLGNAFHDDKMDAEAEAAYLESLTMAREHGLLRQQGHALQVLARLRHDQNRDEEAIEFGKQALSMYTSLGEVVKMAAVQSYLARSLLRLDLLNEAAEHYQQAADNYERIGQFDDASYDYQQAATLWYKLGMQANALLCVERGVSSAFHYSNPVRAAAVLADVPDEVHRTNIGELYLVTLRQFAGGKTPRPFVGTMINFAIHCKKDQDAELFQNGLKVITESLTNTARPEVLYALAQAVEQAGNELMTTESLYKLASNIAKDVDHLHFRHMPGQASIWTIGMAWDRPLVAQVVTYSDGITSNRVAMALALMIRAGSDLIGKAVSSYGGNLEPGFELDVVTHSELAEAGINIDVEQGGPPASVTASAVPHGQPQPPTVLVLHDDYDTGSDWAANPGTKAFVWVLMLTHSAVVADCVHGNRDELNGLARKSRRFCEVVLK